MLLAYRLSKVLVPPVWLGWVVGSVSRAQLIQIEYDFNLPTGDLQILKLSADKRNAGNVSYRRVIGGDLRNHQVRGHHIGDI